MTRKCSTDSLFGKIDLAAKCPMPGVLDAPDAGREFAHCAAAGSWLRVMGGKAVTDFAQDVKPAQIGQAPRRCWARRMGD